MECQCFSVTGSHGLCERCKYDSQSCSFLKNAAKESKEAKEVKVKKEPGVGEGSVSGTKVGTKRKAVAKVNEQETKQKPKKSRASSFASAGSTGNSHTTSISIPSIPLSSLISNEDFNMDAFIPNFDEDPVGQILAILDSVLENAKGVVKGAMFLKKAIKDLRLAEGGDGAGV